MIEDPEMTVPIVACDITSNCQLHWRKLLKLTGRKVLQFLAFMQGSVLGLNEFADLLIGIYSTCWKQSAAAAMRCFRCSARHVPSFTHYRLPSRVRDVIMMLHSRHSLRHCGNYVTSRTMSPESCACRLDRSRTLLLSFITQ